MEHALTHRPPSEGRDQAPGRPRLWLLLSAADTRYAVEAGQVVEVVVSVELAPVCPGAEGLAGLINYHGRMLPVVDLCRLTLGRDCQRLLSTRIVMVQIPPMGLIGLRAERVTDGIWPEPTDLVCAEGGLRDAVYLRRVVGGRTEMVLVLCLNRLLPESLQRRLTRAPAS